MLTTTQHNMIAKRLRQLLEGAVTLEEAARDPNSTPAQKEEWQATAGRYRFARMEIIALRHELDPANG